MDQILNPFDQIKPFHIKPSDYLQFKKLITRKEIKRTQINYYFFFLIIIKSRFPEPYGSCGL